VKTRRPLAAETHLCTVSQKEFGQAETAQCAAAKILIKNLKTYFKWNSTSDSLNPLFDSLS